MIVIDVPGLKKIQLSHLILDYNGTIAVDGFLIQGVKEKLRQLANDLEIHVLSADTFGNVKAQLEEITCKLTIIPQENQDEKKMAYVHSLGSENCVCIGNGRIDKKKCPNHKNF